MKTPDPAKKAEPSAPDKRKFTGTDNPRQLRAIDAVNDGQEPFFSDGQQRFLGLDD